jgi:hypothetical protein
LRIADSRHRHTRKIDLAPGGSKQASAETLPTASHPNRQKKWST